MANGDDDTGSVLGGTDEGGGMVTEPSTMPSPVEDDDLARKTKRKTRRSRRGKARRARRTKR